VSSELIRFVKVKYASLTLFINEEFINRDFNHDNLLFKLDIHFSITSVVLETHTIVTKIINIVIVLAFNLLLIDALISQIFNTLMYLTSM